ncbi:MAG: hypothetical protein R3C25_13870 [Hyphomonadaceae bacterium]
MKKMLFAAVGFASIASAAGFAMAQDGGPARPGLFQADANSDGVLTRQEFDAGRDAMFASIDTDNNGVLSREEMRAHHGERGHGRRGRSGGRGGQEGMHMGGADANNDGVITRDEFLARPIAMFERMDANHDGVISQDERPQRPERPGRGERREMREHMNPDANNDGSVSRAEFAAMGQRMFERLDANNDGRVTQEEARAGHGRRGGGR